MKKFIGYFRNYHKEYFNLRLYLVVLAFIAVLIALNYTFNIEDGFIDQYRGRPVRILLFFLIHAVAYFGVVIILKAFKPDIKITIGFVLKSALGILILAVDRSVYPNFASLFLSEVPRETYRFLGKILQNSYGLVTVVTVLVVVQFLLDSGAKEGLYGLRLKKVDFRACFTLLLIMVPIVYAASWLPSFISYYPCYKRAGGAIFANYYGIDEVVCKVVYEFFYLSNFLCTELVFRGFLIIGLSRLFGKNVLLPMVAAYAVLHFGKPMGEAISSVFGGYILGVIALYSRNIWGGVFLHGGVAFLMEIFAFLRM